MPTLGVSLGSLADIARINHSNPSGTIIPMGNLFSNYNQLLEWLEAAEGIEARVGIDNALGCVIGDKFYNVVSAMHFYRKQISMIENERKKSDYKPIREITIERLKYTENWDETY